MLKNLFTGTLGGSRSLTLGSESIYNHNFYPTCLSTRIESIRFKHSKRVNPKEQRKVEGGIEYHGFKYFPRFPDQVDPPCNPSKLFMIRRIRSLKRKPYFERNIMAHLNLEDRSKVAIVKNTPTSNALLYKVKHLIEITPITFPHGIPESPEYGFLKENGEFTSTNSLEGHSIKLEAAVEKDENFMKTQVDGPTLKSRLRSKWYSRW